MDNIELVQYLKQKSLEICELNNCHDGYDHYCESYAYITGDYQLIDICTPDFFQGSSEPYASIPLPLPPDITQEELEKLVDDDIVIY